MGHTHSSPLYGNKVGICHTPHKQHHGKCYVALQMNLKTRGLFFFFFSLRALPVPHFSSSGSSQRSRRASCIPVRPSCCPCFHSGVCPWLRVDDHFPNCAKKWCLKIDVNLSQHSDLNLWSLISDLPGEKIPRGKRAPGKVLALGRGSRRGWRGTIGSTQAGWLAFPASSQGDSTRPSVRSSQWGCPQSLPAAGRPCLLES